MYGRTHPGDSRNSDSAYREGVDPSAGFIEYAKSRIASPVASFEMGDARSLPVDPASFDVAVAGLVLNFVPEPSGAIAEMTRAVRPGGAVAAYVWDYAGKMELMRYFWDAAVALDPAALISTRGAGFRSARRSRLLNCSPGGTPRGGGSSDWTFPRGFAISMITGLHSSGPSACTRLLSLGEDGATRPRSNSLPTPGCAGRNNRVDRTCVGRKRARPGAASLTKG